MDQTSLRVAIPVVLLSAAISGVVSAVVALAVTSPTEPPGPVASSPVNLAPVMSRLEELGRRIDERATVNREPVPTARTVDFAEGVADSTAVESALRRIADQLAYPASARPLRRDVPPNWNELYRLAALEDADRKTAQQSVVMLTASEIIARFGFPTQVEPGQEGLFCWKYFRLGPDGSRAGARVTFYLNDGYVSWFDSRL